MATVTRTRTHVHVEFSDPYKTCRACGGWVTGWHDVHACGCSDDSREDYLVPCGCRSDYQDVCPSWGPVDGCRCLADLGCVGHPAPETGAAGALL